MASPTNTQQTQARSTQVAVKPSNTITKEDLKAASHKFDLWLQSMTHGVVSLERLEAVAGGVPVLGNIIALVSVGMDVYELHEKHRKNEPIGALDYLNLGIDGIGLIPIPPALAPMRMALQPMLAAVRHELVQQGKLLVKDYGKALLGDSLVTLLGEHLNATIVGDIEAFVTEAQKLITQILTDAGALLEKLLLDLGDGLRRAALGELDTAGTARQAGKEGREAVDVFVHDPGKGIKKGLASLFHTYEAEAQFVSNTAVNALASPEQRRHLADTLEKDMKKLAGLCRKSLNELADPKTGAIAKLLSILLDLIQAYRKKNGKGKNSNVKQDHVNKAEELHGMGQLATVHVETPSMADCGCKKNVSKTGSGNSISFARGAERIAHGDFSLPGLFALDWERMYRSDLAAYDSGPLGARWTSPFTTRLDIVRHGARPETVLYHAVDGRTHDWPLPKVGAFHYDAIENVTLVRVAENSVAVAHGFDVKETYERHGSHFRLINITLRNGAMVACGATIRMRDARQSS